MQEIAISKFEATCVAVLERVRRTRQPIRVTRFGDPVAGTGQIVGDIVSPAGDEKDWEALNTVDRRTRSHIPRTS
jgi:hypothetical protein